MKESKKFFYTNNKLNKGYNPEDTTSFHLPPLEVLEDYEKVSKGSIDKIIALAEKEQRNRADAISASSDKWFRSLDAILKAIMFLAICIGTIPIYVISFNIYVTLGFTSAGFMAFIFYCYLTNNKKGRTSSNSNNQSERPQHQQYSYNRRRN